MFEGTGCFVELVLMVLRTAFGQRPHTVTLISKSQHYLSGDTMGIGFSGAVWLMSDVAKLVGGWRCSFCPSVSVSSLLLVAIMLSSGRWISG